MINDTVNNIHAYIVFKREESAQASLSHNMAVVGGYHIQVNTPTSEEAKEGMMFYSMIATELFFVDNLPFDVMDLEIYQMFSSLHNVNSNIEAICVVRDPGASTGKSTAYVLFNTRDAANLVVRKHNLKIWDRDLSLYYTKSNVTPLKRKELSVGLRSSSGKKLVVDF